MVYGENNNQYEYQQENSDGNTISAEFKNYQKEVSAPIVDNKLIDLETNTQNQLRFSTLLSNISDIRSELTDAKHRRGKEVRKTVKYIKERFDKLEFNIKEVQSGKYTNIKPEHVTGLITKTQALLHDATDYKSQLVTGDLDEAKRYFPPNIFDDTGYYIPDIKKGDFDKKKSNTQTIDSQTNNIHYTKEVCNTTPIVAQDAKEAFEKGGIVGFMDYRGAKSNMDPKMRSLARGTAFLGLAGLGIRGIKKLYGSFKEGGRRKTPATLIAGTVGLNMASGLMTGKPFGLTDIFKGFALGGNDLPKRLLSVGEITIDKAGKVISDSKNKSTPTAMEIMQPSLISSYFLRDIPFASLMQPIQTIDGVTKSILGIENNTITGCNVDALQMYINSNNNIDSKNKKERQQFIDEYNDKSDEDKKKIQQLFISGLIGLGITNETIKNNPTHNLADNHYKPKINELAQQAQQEQQEEEEQKKEKINNSGEVYDGKDIANVKPSLEQIGRDITDPTIKAKYTTDFQSRLEKKLNILYIQDPKSGPIEIYFDKVTNKLNLKSYNQISTLDVLSGSDIISIPYSAMSRKTSSLEEAVHIGRLTNLVTAPAPLGFGGASTVENPFNLSYTETERDIEFNKTDRWTAIKNLSIKQGMDTTIIYDTRSNNFDENFPSINENKTEFINWLNGFKKNGKSIWKK